MYTCTYFLVSLSCPLQSCVGGSCTHTHTHTHTHRYGIDLPAIELILKEKLRKFHAEEPHEEWAGRFFKANQLHAQPYLPMLVSKTGGGSGGGRGGDVSGGDEAVGRSGEGERGGAGRRAVLLWVYKRVVVYGLIMSL